RRLRILAAARMVVRFLFDRLRGALAQREGGTARRQERGEDGEPLEGTGGLPGRGGLLGLAEEPDDLLRPVEVGREFARQGGVRREGVRVGDGGEEKPQLLDVSGAERARQIRGQLL